MTLFTPCTRTTGSSPSPQAQHPPPPPSSCTRPPPESTYSKSWPAWALMRARTADKVDCLIKRSELGLGLLVTPEP
eukprot:1083293-Rhodomonas_salina.1